MKGYINYYKFIIDYYFHYIYHCDYRHVYVLLMTRDQVFKNLMPSKRTRKKIFNGQIKSEPIFLVKPIRYKTAIYVILGYLTISSNIVFTKSGQDNSEGVLLI